MPMDRMPNAQIPNIKFLSLYINCRDSLAFIPSWDLVIKHLGTGCMVSRDLVIASNVFGYKIGAPKFEFSYQTKENLNVAFIDFQSILSNFFLFFEAPDM